MLSEPNSVDVLLREAGASLLAAAQGNDASANAAMALRAVLLATDRPDICAASREIVPHLQAALEAAMHVVAADVSAIMPAEHVAFSMGCASCLLEFIGRPAEDLRKQAAELPAIRDRLDYAALLASELEAVCRRRRIAARGDHLRQYVEMKIGLPGEIPEDVTLH